ncbi:lactosylceramide 4-alpha-galactosyltransferase-like isoform X2 [Zophobas morio]|uniref:lactosylceramide 4-alpha-galactosyltransferase-like isoform X2 n=1 Tax=Zophobas morio TaxID=2755281 RepID=UPI003082963E
MYFILRQFAIIYYLMYFFQLKTPDNDNPTGHQCYHQHSESLPSIQDSRPKDKSIFFHETSCKSAQSGKIVITAREACAVESAAKLHPNYETYLLYVSPGIIKNEGTESDRFLQALLSYDNVRIRHLDLGNYVEDTPVESLWKRGTLERSYHVTSHTSDLLRYLTLWKYGGLYLDLDVVVIKPLDTLPPNYAGVESDSLVAAGVINLESAGLGHVLATYCLKDLRENFNGTEWIRNGPGVITRLAKNICASENVRNFIGRDCAGGFKIYPSEAFYPVPWYNWTMYFMEEYVRDVEVMTEDSFVVHVWNKLSFERKVPVGAKVPYVLFAQKFCPKVYQECERYF